MEYPKIETLYERDMDTFKVNPVVLKNPVYGIIKTWQFTEKIDGTNIRCIWEPLACPEGHSVNAAHKFCSGCGVELTEKIPMSRLTFGGKTDSAQIHADLIRHLYATVTVDSMRAVFPETKAVLYGEGYGAGIQKGGDYSDTKKFILFDVLVGGEWWLNWNNTCDVAAKLGLDTVPYFGEMTLSEATDIVRNGFRSRLNGGKAQAEGLVGRTVEALFDKKGARLIVKLKTKDFA